MSKAQLLEDIFEVLEKDPDGKKFDKGGRGPGDAHVAVRHAVAAAAAGGACLLQIEARLLPALSWMQ